MGHSFSKHHTELLREIVSNHFGLAHYIWYPILLWKTGTATAAILFCTTTNASRGATNTTHTSKGSRLRDTRGAQLLQHWDNTDGWEKRAGERATNMSDGRGEMETWMGRYSC